MQERVAIVSTHLPEVQTDESTLITASTTGMVEAMDAKGSGWSTGTRLDEFTEEAGVEAAHGAIRALGGERVPSGRYRIVLGPQPVTDLLNNLVLPALHASSFYASTTPFLGRFGKRVAAPALSIYDHGALAGFTGSKGITCEGLPTGRTDLVTDGILTGLLTNWYEAQRLLRDPQARAKLGVDPAEAAGGLVARNGFRFAAGGGPELRVDARHRRDQRLRGGPGRRVARRALPAGRATGSTWGASGTPIRSTGSRRATSPAPSSATPT